MSISKGLTCPHCLIGVHLSIEASGYSSGQMKIERGIGQSAHLVEAALCPICCGLIVIYTDPVSLFPTGVPNPDAPHGQTGIIYPRNPALKPLPPEVPQIYREDFDEARLVLDLSPKSSAALSRRLLQRLLHERFGINKPNLQQEIQEFINTRNPPTQLAEQLDAIRLVGNFAAHPIKDTITGLITDVAEGEGELLIETLESLFDYSFVQPAKWAASKAEINTKLSAADKPTIP
jgi:hypothetical protein